MANKRLNLTLKQKVGVIKKWESGIKQNQISKESKISKSTVSGILRTKSKILKQFENLQSNAKRVRKLKFDDIDGALLDWFKINRNNNVPLNGPLLIAQAQNFATNFGKTDFKASEGWLDKWKKRHNIVFRTVCGEAAAVDEEVVDNWIKDKWPELSHGYRAKDIFNCDESGLFYKMLPNKSLDFKNETCSGGKRSKERVTVLNCCNSDGSEKRKLLVVGKSQKPRVFKKINGSGALPVEYYANKKSWMVTEIFEGWLRRLDKEMQRKGRKILLTLDNVSCHPQNIKLKHVKLVYFPPNCTAKLQPLDQGIIQNMKMKYRSLIVNKILRKLDKGMDPSIDLLEGVLALNTAWIHVKETTISNCFRHAKVVASDDTDPPTDEVEEDDEDNIPLAELARRLNLDRVPTAAEYVNFDNDVATSALPTVEEIAEKYRPSKPDEIDLSDDDGEPELSSQDVSTEVALDAIEKLNVWLVSHNENCDPVYFNTLSKLEVICNEVRRIEMKQTRITDYFHLGAKVHVNPSNTIEEVVLSDDEENFLGESSNSTGN